MKPALPVAVLVTGACALGFGLWNVTADEPARRGVHEAHVDDVDAQTLAAWGAVHMDGVHVLWNRQARVCNGTDCRVAVPAGTQQVLDDCGRGQDCAGVRLVALMDGADAARLQQAMAGPVDLQGMHAAAPEAFQRDVQVALTLPGVNWKLVGLLDVGVRPGPPMGAAAFAGAGFLLVLAGAMMLVWRLRGPAHRREPPAT